MRSFRRRRSRRDSCAVVGLVTIVLWKQGILHEAFYWTVGDHDVPHVFWRKGMVNTLSFVGACLPLVIGAIIGVPGQGRDLGWDGGRGGRRFSDCSLPRRLALRRAPAFTPHYYVQLIPPSAFCSRHPYCAATVVPADASAALAIATCGDLRRGWLSRSLSFQSCTGRGWLRDASRRRRDDICPSIRALTIEFSSGARLRKSI